MTQFSLTIKTEHVSYAGDSINTSQYCSDMKETFKACLSTDRLCDWISSGIINRSPHEKFWMEFDEYDSLS